MAFNTTTDFVGLVRNDGARDIAAKMPPLDFVVTILAQLGLITLVSDDVEPIADQETTAWLDPAGAGDQTGSHLINGTLRLWDGAAYVAATPVLFAALVSASSTNPNHLKGAAVPAVGVGVDGDFYFRTSSLGGVYSKAVGAWAIIPGTEIDTPIQLGSLSEA